MKGLNAIDIVIPTEEILESSIRNNIFYYHVCAWAWIGFMLYGIAHKDLFLYLDAILFFIAAVGFRIMQKIDSARLELMRK